MIVSKIIVVFEELFFFDHCEVIIWLSFSCLRLLVSPMIMFEESDSKLGNLSV